MNLEEKLPTITRDLREVYDRLRRAWEATDPELNPEVWADIDHAITILEGLGFFLKTSEPPDDPNEAAKALVDQVIGETEGKEPSDVANAASKEPLKRLLDDS